MTMHLKELQTVSVTDVEKKMLPDEQCASASAQLVSLRPSMSDDQHHQSSLPASALVLSFAQDALRPCVYIALRCSRCGNVRQGVAELPAHHAIACAECGRECAFVVLGVGLTKRNLPFHELHLIEPTRWDQHSDVETDSS